MTTKTEIQALLRFLSQDAKIPLPTAMAKVRDLQSAHLASAESLAKTSITAIQTIFKDEKQAKSVLAAAKRVTKKRAAGESDGSSPAKRSKPSSLIGSDPTPASLESSLALPLTTVNDEELMHTVIYTNRAPLVLAFAVTLLKYTMPAQPVSSRLSLAQAVVSVNSKSKAVTIGLAEKSSVQEDEGWGVGQPGIKVMSREIKVMRRHGYDPTEGSLPTETSVGNVKEELKSEETDSQATLKQEGTSIEDEPALWGLDLEALRKSNGPLVPGEQKANGVGLPIYNAQNARAYLMKSFATPPVEAGESGLPVKKPSAAAQRAEKEENLGRLLSSLELLHASWAPVLAKEELDRRSWSWYVAVRPDVKDGVAGWGGKGEVKLAKILEMRRKG